MLLAHTFERVAGFLREFRRDAAGATAVIFSFSTVVVMGSIAFGVDTANWFQTDRRLQTGTDLAAVSVASDQALAFEFDYAMRDRVEIAREELERDGVKVAGLTSLEVNSPPLSGAFAGNPNAVEVITSQDVEIFFAGMFMDATPQAQARAVALSSFEGNYCILTLDENEPGAVTFSGSSSSFLGCGIASNSNAPNSVWASGSSIVQTTVVTAVGGISDNGNIETPVHLQEYSNPISNPYEDVVAPPSAPCDYNNVRVSGNETLQPGVYCGDLRINGDATFEPGTYVLDGADFIINAGATAFGDDVTFVFTDNPTLNNVGAPRFNGSATINFSAPDTGDYAGMVFLRDPDAPNVVGNNADTWLINGNASSSFEGVFYVPGAELELTGNALFNNGCIQIVSGAVTINGNFNVTQQCSDPNLRAIQTVGVTLVE
jgi:hypothetical protein